MRLEHLQGYARAVVVALCLALATLALASPAAAQHFDQCAPNVGAWVSACSRAAGRPMRADYCTGARALISVETTPGAPSLHVDVGRADGRAFQTRGRLGFSPVGNFADWDREPEAVRGALSALLTCAERDGSLEPWAPPVRTPEAGTRKSFPSVPWALLVGIGCGLALVARYARRIPRRAGMRALPLVGLAAGTWVLERLLAAPAFFHQNAQGALWVRYSFCAPSSYGPGYAELFGTFARAARAAPEGGVFAAQSLLGATVPVSAYGVARRAGAPVPVARAIALAFAIWPVLARIARSESYYLTAGALLLAAGALLGAGARPMRVRSLNFALGVVGAAALAAQAARVHPVAWVPAALIPAVLLAGPGRFRARWNATLGAALGVGLLTVAWDAREMIAVLRGELGRHWVGASVVHPQALPLWPLLALIIVPLARPRARVRALVAALCFIVTVSVARRMDPVGSVEGYVSHAYYFLYASLLVASVVAAIDALARTRVMALAAAAAVLLVGAGAFVAHRGALRAEFTGPIELGHALGWRSRLPQDARLVYVARAGHFVIDLPLYASCSEGGVLPMALDAAEPMPDDASLGSSPFYYYRSSVCATEDGARYCDQLESRLSLEPVDEATLPGRSDMRQQRYNRPVRVGLYRARLRDSAGAGQP